MLSFCLIILFNQDSFKAALKKKEVNRLFALPPQSTCFAVIVLALIMLQRTERA